MPEPAKPARLNEPFRTRSLLDVGTGCHGECVSVAGSACDKWEMWFRSCPDAVALASFPGGTLLDVNTRFCAMLGYRREELINQAPEAIGLLVHPERIPVLAKRLQEFSSIQDYESEVRTRDGRVLHVHTSMQLLAVGGQPAVLVMLRDLTSIRNAERALRTVSEALEAAAEGIAFIDVQGRYTTVNAAYCEMLRCDRGDLIGRPWADTVHPDDLGEMYVAYEQMLESGRSSIDVRGVRRDRSVFDKQVILVRLQDADGAFAGHCRCTTDITARRLRERSVAASEARLRAIWNSTPEGVMVIDRALVISDLNPVGLKMLECETVETVRGQSINQYVDSPSRDRIVAAILAAFAGKPASVEFDLTSISGSRRWVESTIVPLIDDDSKADYVLLINRDISKRKYAEAALRRSESRYSDLLENANDLIFMLDAEGCFTSLNRTSELLLGYDRAELLNKPIFAIVSPDSMDTARRVFQATDSASPLSAVETISVQTKDGRTLTLEISTRSVFEDLQFVGVQAIARDITERERNRIQMEGAQRAEALGRLAAGVAHDFNNVLAIIMASAELQLSSPSADGNQARLAREIVKAAHKAANLTSKLLTFSRRQSSAPRTIRMNEVIRDMAELLERLLGKKIKLNLQLGEVSTEVHADPTQLEQVLVNLVANAKDAMDGGGSLTIATSVTHLDLQYSKHHDPVRPGKYVKLSVTDTGTGIDRETLRHIFEPFFTTKADKGTGLGLATVYGIVKNAGGYVWAYSELGQGTTFKIYLPALESSNEGTSLESPRTTKSAPKILVVDDDAELRGVTLQGLAERGFLASEACSGAAALRQLEDAHPPFDVLLTDLVMPVMDGHQLREAALRAQPSLLVVLTSGFGEAQLDSTSASVIPVIEKPFRLDSLAARLRALVVSNNSARP